jgi:LPXTG-site transpeptidase (sortase) family protein
MKRNKKTVFILLLTIFAILFFTVVFIHAIFYAPATEGIDLPVSLVSVVSLPTPIQQIFAPIVSINKKIVTNFPSSYPKRLRIPVINVDANVQYVGVTKNGKMATPNNFSDVGWFQSGTIPGEKGSAVVAGHVDDGLAFPAVFANLNQLVIGQDIYIDTVGGATLDFKVIDLTNYDPIADTQEIFNQNDGNYLKLITCAGIWSEQYKTHNQRLVVTAEQVE